MPKVLTCSSPLKLHTLYKVSCQDLFISFVYEYLQKAVILYSGKRWREKIFWRIQLFRLFGGENFGEWPLPCSADLNGCYMLCAVIQHRWRKAQTRVS